MELIKEKWEEILLTVRREYDLTDISYKSWLQPLSIVSINGKKVSVNVPSGEMGVTYIKKKYLFPLQVAVAEITGVEYEIELVAEDQSSKEEKQNSVEDSRANAAKERAGLNPKYTFDTFVVGSNNKFAHAAALAVAESPGKIWNPLFIYGGAGLGKTHLMHSIAHYILDNNPEMNVLYVSSETFTNDLIYAIKNVNNTAISEFREKYRNVDVLLIDDIQFIIGKEATQEEFFHTFNDLKGADKQIIISSDKPPKEFETLEERMRTRFEWGILADISQPDFETRMAILRSKEETQDLNIDDKIIEYIALNIKSNIRELEGAYNKLLAMQKLERKPITLEMAEEALKDIISPDSPRIVTPELIIETVADHFHIQPSDIMGKKKSNDIVIPRQIVMYLCRSMLDIPLKSVGSYIGNRDHSTISHGVDKIENEMKTSENLRNTVDIIMKKLSPG